MQRFLSRGQRQQTNNRSSAALRPSAQERNDSSEVPRAQPTNITCYLQRPPPVASAIFSTASSLCSATKKSPDRCCLDTSARHGARSTEHEARGGGVRGCTWMRKLYDGTTERSGDVAEEPVGEERPDAVLKPPKKTPKKNRRGGRTGALTKYRKMRISVESIETSKARQEQGKARRRQGKARQGQGEAR